MKRTMCILGFSALLLLVFQPAAGAANATSIEGNEYFCVGVMAGFVNGYVPGTRLIMDRLSFSSSFLSFGVLSMQGLNDASGIYSIEDEDFGLEKIKASCSSFDSEKELYLKYAIKAVNIIDVGIVGTIRVEGEKDYDDAGSATGFFFGIRNILD